MNLLVVLLFHRGCPPDYTDWEDGMYGGVWNWLKEQREMGLSRFPWESQCEWEKEHIVVNGFCQKCKKDIE